MHGKKIEQHRKHTPFASSCGKDESQVDIFKSFPFGTEVMKN